MKRKPETKRSGKAASKYAKNEVFKGRSWTLKEQDCIKVFKPYHGRSKKPEVRVVTGTPKACLWNPVLNLEF